jgi:hypothetical protein
MRVFRFSRFPRLSRLFRRKTDAAVQYLRRAKAEPDPLRRLALLDRARDAAPPSDAARVGRLHAELALDLLRSRKLEWSKSETIRLARELESLGAPLAAAEAFAFAGDQDGELDALAEAGAIDTLEATFDGRRARERRLERLDNLHSRLIELDGLGRRRRVLEMATRLATREERFDRLARDVERNRIAGPTVNLMISGVRADVALGDAVTLGREGATIPLGSPAVSRLHLEVARGATGIAVVDPGSTNGTTLRGLRVARLDLGAGLDLLLGGEVPVLVEPRAAGGVTIVVAGRRVEAPLGPLRIGEFTVAVASDGWVELSSAHGRAILGALEVNTPIELAKHDVVRLARAGPAILEVLG